jgi:hypothetical protein
MGNVAAHTPEPELGPPTRVSAPRLEGAPELALRLAPVVGNRGLARAIRQRRVLARDLNSDYEDAVKRGDWKAAAEYLNGFNRDDILKRLRARGAEEIAKLHQGALDNAKVGPNSQIALLTPTLLSAFGLQFRDSAELVRANPEAMKLVTEGEKAGIKYGGFSEDGPGKTSVGANAYTVGDTIYVPKARLGDKVWALNGFLFEINNAVRKDRFAAVAKDASEGKIGAEEYARREIGLEVEGMLRMGDIWASMKPALGGGKALDKYDDWFYMSEHGAVASGKKTAADIATDVGQRKYTVGAAQGKTVKQYYIEGFNRAYGKK